MNMMHHGGMCRCPHHKFAMLLGLLGFIAALAFFWSAWSLSIVWEFDSDFYFQAVIVLALMAHGTSMCRCCGWGRMGMQKGGACTHGEGCRCGDCDRCK